MVEGDRIKDLRKRDYGEGVIVGHVKDGEEYWIIRWDDSGLDNEWLEAREFELLPIKSEMDHSNCRDCPRCGDPECLHQEGTCKSRNGCDCQEFIRARKIYMLTNGTVAVFDKAGEQIPAFQGTWINFGYLRELMKTLKQDNPKLEGVMRLPSIIRETLFPERECTCGDYPHHELCGAVQDYPDSEGKNGN